MKVSCGPSGIFNAVLRVASKSFDIILLFTGGNEFVLCSVSTLIPQSRDRVFQGVVEITIVPCILLKQAELSFFVSFTSGLKKR